MNLFPFHGHDYRSDFFINKNSLIEKQMFQSGKAGEVQSVYNECILQVALMS